MEHVKDYGAVGDGVADDTAVILAAFASGAPLDWGVSGDVYRVTDPLQITLASPLRWVSDGAVILYDGATPVQHALRIDSEGHPIRIDGGLTIDANRIAFTCLYLHGAGDAAPVTLTDLTLTNGYRSSTAFTGGDGLWVRGAFDPVTLDRVTVRDMSMHPDAAVFGSQGITGITVSAIDSAHIPGTVSILSPMVENILSEDTTTYMDQDAIRVMTAMAEPGVVAPYETQVRIEGGEVRNSGGRALKSQVPWSSVSDLKVYRDVQRARVARELDFQKGGGHVSNVYVHYVGSASETLVCFEGGQTDAVTVPHGSVSGLRLLIEGTAEQTDLVKVRDVDGVGTRVICRGVEQVGGTLRYIARMDGSPRSSPTLVLSDVIAAPTVAGITTYYANEWTGLVILSNVINSGAPVPVQERSTGNTATLDVRATNVVGLSGAMGSESLHMAGLVTGWSEVGEGCVAYRSGGAVTYTFQLRGPSSGSIPAMAQLPDGWMPRASAVVELRSFDSAERLADLFIGTDGKVHAYRAVEGTWWGYGAVTLPA